MTNTALLVIDMQQGSFTPQTPRFDTGGVVKRINTLVEAFRRSGQPVIFVQHDGTREQAFIPGTTAWKLLPELDAKPGDIMVSKVANDAFYASMLSSELSKLEINELFITGCATDFCVESTIRSALAKDYKVTVVEDGHTTGERPHLSAEQVINHCNWVWQNLLPTGGSVNVISTEKIMDVFRKSNH